MTTFNLTTKLDKFGGGTDPDIFAGPGGGNDVLDGGVGNDKFTIDSLQTGSLSGGADTDTVIASENQLDHLLKFSGVEVLKAETTNLYATVAQLAEFSTITADAGGTNFYVFLQYEGGTLDFSTRFVSPILLQVEASLCDSAVQLTGTAHADFIIGSNFGDIINGGSGVDEIYGGGGDDTINGGNSADTMSGSFGNDTFYVNSVNDVVQEVDGQGTADLVMTNTSYTLAAGVAVELLRTTSASGTSALTLTGNEYAQRITGNAGANSLFGGGKDDVLNGLQGADKLDGGDGSDTATYAGATAAVTASLAKASINTGDAKGDTYVSVENLTGTSFNDKLYGTNGINIIDGGAGNDDIKGYDGGDTLTGGKGLDNFILYSAVADNVDKITDFNVADDTIQLDDLFFTKVGAPGVLATTAFYAGTAAHDSDDRIIYYATTGEISYDADGDGTGSAVVIATVTPGLILTNADFLVI